MAASTIAVLFTLLLLAVVLLGLSNAELRQRLQIARTRAEHLEEVEDRLAVAKMALAMANQLIEELQLQNDAAGQKQDLAIAGLHTIASTIETARKR